MFLFQERMFTVKTEWMGFEGRAIAKLALNCIAKLQLGNAI
jgi:hypothetical protein